MTVHQFAWSRYGVAIVAAIILLTACGGSQSAPTAIPQVVPTATAAATAVPPTATPLPPTPIPPTPTPIAATATIAPAGTVTIVVATNAAATPSVAATPSDPRAQAVVDKARTRFDTVNALHFALTTDGDVYLDKTHTEKLKSGDGDLVRPDKVALTAKAAVGPVNAQIKFIQIGDTSYITNIISGKWEQAPSGFGYDPRLVFDKDRGVAAILANVSGWSLIGTEKVNGSDTQHVRAPVPTATVNDLVNASLRGDSVDVDLFIEPKNNDVVRMIIAERPDAVTTGTVAARWLLDLSKQNENIKIEPPALGS